MPGIGGSNYGDLPYCTLSEWRWATGSSNTGNTPCRVPIAQRKVPRIRRSPENNYDNITYTDCIARRSSEKAHNNNQA